MLENELDAVWFPCASPVVSSSSRWSQAASRNRSRKGAGAGRRRRGGRRRRRRRRRRREGSTRAARGTKASIIEAKTVEVYGTVV